jgi:ABC-2 type transport system ATP-binding protein
MTPVIELDGLEVRFGSRRILHGLKARLTGRAIGLLGPNGAGKTTLVNTLLGFHRPQGGRVIVLGRDAQAHARRLRGIVGYVPENDAFVAGLTVVRFVRMMGELSGLPPREALERAHETLHYVGLGEVRYRRVETLSQGMKQLAKLAQAIVHAPELLILDEPTNGLDPPHRLRMLRLIREIAASGRTHVLLSSHLLRDVEECCGQVLILKEGRIAAYRDLEEERRLNRRFLELEVRGADEAFVAAIGRLGCECAQTRRDRLKVVLPEHAGVEDIFRIAAEQQVQLRRLSFKRDSLEEIFLAAMETPHGGV